MKGNNKIKRLASILAFVILFQYVSIIVPFLEVNADEATDEYGVTWSYTLDSNGNATSVTWASGTVIRGTHSYQVEIPATLDGHKVVSIGTDVIPGTASWPTSGSIEVKIPEGVEKIDEYAFCGNYSFNGYGYTGNPFVGRLTKINIPSTVTSIGRYAFYDCSGLTSMDIPSSVTIIGTLVFDHCTNLTEINVDANNTQYTSEDGILFNKEKTRLIKFPEGKKDITEYVIPDGVTAIDSCAFRGCDNLTKIVIPSSVTTIGAFAFSGCSNLENIEIPSSVETLGNSAFSNCSKLKSIEIPSLVKNLGESVFSGCTSLTNVTIPDTVTSMGQSLFKDCTSLTSITIPSNIKIIDASVFENCTSLASATIPNGVTSIGKNAFYNCTNLTSVTIPNSVTSIGNNTFANCSSLESINLPNSLTSIDVGAFQGTALKTINIPASVTSIKSYVFSNCESLEEINVNNNNRNYKSNDGVLFDISGTTLIQYPDAKKTEKYIVPTGVTTIKSMAFAGKEGITVIIPQKGAMSIEGSALNKNILVKCLEGTQVHTYLEKNGIPYEFLIEADFEDSNLYNKIKGEKSEFVVNENSEELKLILENEITNLDIQNSNIESLRGLEVFTKLTRIKCK